MRRVLRGGIIGGLPGLLIGVVPLLLHELDFITADQSQVGFIGIPLLFFGVIFGILWGAADTGYTGKVMLGVLAGFVIGIVGGLLLDAAFDAAGLPRIGFVLWLIPVGMIGGGMLGVRWGEHRSTSLPPAAQH